MRIPRHHVTVPLRLNTEVELDADSAHYLGKVLRLGAGQPLMLFNGRDGEFLGEISAVSKKQLRVLLTQQLPPCQADPVLPVHIGVGLSRGERMDFIVQKATELGVNTITPLFTEHGEVRLDEDRAGKRQAHWQKVAISACEQSTRCQVPEIARPMSLPDWLSQIQHRNGGCFVLDHRQQAGFPRDPKPAAVTLLSGPEGGLSTMELDLAINQHGFQPVRLGPRVLRTETAPLAALSLVQMLWGDF
ncbi:MAG: 16S rRNA (uracil(1498)-N(3))-methyltransferase [Pseudomonadales bacterium]|nr:16S rRNA (uracil(1498)-N(3))-methyltransferase [Pseudomonadales bacterium]